MDHTIDRFPKLQRRISLLVAGHRAARLGNRGDAALARLDAVIARFTDAGLAASLFAGALYDQDTPLRVTALTGSCDGVDAHVRAMKNVPGLTVQLIEAAAPDAVSQGPLAGVHFACPAAVLETDDAAHGLRDEYALLHADVLVAVWDGEAPQGRSGGVVRMIQHAIEVGTPVLWIDLDGQLRELDTSRIDGSNRFHAAHAVFRHRQVDGGRMFTAPLDDPLTPTIRQWLNPIGDDSGAQDREEGARTLAAYAGETAGPRRIERRAGLVDRVCSALVLLDGGKLAKAFRSDPTGHWDATPANMALPAGLRERLAWSDVRANIAAGRHRSRIWLLYLLSAFAVLAAVAGTLHVGVGHEGWQAFVWPALEAVALTSIIVLVRGAHHSRWHARWLGQRLMAEQLRYLALTRPFLGVTKFFALPPFGYDTARGRTVLQHAEAWLLRRALIVQGVTGHEDGYSLDRVDQAMLARSLQAMIDDDDIGQIRYHHGKTKDMRALHHAMHNAARTLFALSLAAVAYHIVGGLAHWPHYGWLLFATAFCPAMAAALHGIQTKLEFERTESLSHRTAAELATMSAVVARSLETPQADAWQQTLYLRAAALRTAHVMSDEAQAWRELIAAQDTGLPA